MNEFRIGRAIAVVFVAALSFATVTRAQQPAESEAASGAVVSLYTSGQQPISPELAFRVADASVKDRQLSVTGDLVNVSRDTFNQVQLVIGVERGAEQRVSVGRLVPGASRTVEARLATDSDLKPAILRVAVVRTSVDRSPNARRRH